MTTAEYDPIFLGKDLRIEIPALVGSTFSDAEDGGRPRAGVHCSIIHSTSRRQPLFAAYNTDATHLVRGPADELARIATPGRDAPENYRWAPFVAPSDLAWGGLEIATEARAWALSSENAVLRPVDFDLTAWRNLDLQVLARASGSAYRFSAFIGAIFEDSPIFYKVLLVRTGGIGDRRALARGFVAGRAVALEEIERKGGVSFGDLHRFDPLRGTSGMIAGAALETAESAHAPAEPGDHECDAEHPIDVEATLSKLVRNVDVLAEAVGRVLVSREPEGDPTLERLELTESAVSASSEATRLRPQLAEMVYEIVGGVPTDRDAFSSCTCIGVSDGSGGVEWGCSGVSIHPRLVLTAGHCGPGNRFVFFGNDVRQASSDRVRRGVCSRHNTFDIAMIVLDEPGLGRPAVIANAAEASAARTVKLVGFGRDDPARPKTFGIKREVSVEINLIPPDQVAAAEAELGINYRFEFLAGRKSLGRDTCRGDSGGPAYISVDGITKLMGTTSRSIRRDGRCGEGGIYERVFAFVGWIRQVAAAGGVQL